MSREDATRPGWVCPHGRAETLACSYCALLGENNANSKLTSADAVEVLEMLRRGFSKASIGRHFGVSARTIWFVANGVSWWQVTGIPRRNRSGNV